MDYILFNSDGSIKQRKLTDFIQKGNDGVNSIFVSVEGIDDLDSYTCSVNFELPNGDLTIATPTQVTSNDPITIDGVDYIGWLVPIDAQVTIYEGIVKFSLIITDIVSNPNKVLLTFNANLVINPSVVSPNDTTITVAQYNEILAALNNKANVNGVIPVLKYTTPALPTWGDLLELQGNAPFILEITDTNPHNSYYITIYNPVQNTIVGDIIARNGATKRFITTKGESVYYWFLGNKLNLSLPIIECQKTVTISNLCSAYVTDQKPFILELQYTPSGSHGIVKRYFLSRVSYEGSAYIGEFEEIGSSISSGSTIARYVYSKSTYADPNAGNTTIEDIILTDDTYRENYALKSEITKIYKHAITNLITNYRLIVYSTDGTDYSGQVYVNGSYTITNLIKNALRIDLEGYLSSDAGKNIRNLMFDSVKGGGGTPLSITFNEINTLYGTNATTKTLCSPDTSIQITDVVTQL